MKPVDEIRVLIDRIPYAEGNIGEEAILASLLQDLNACGVKNISVLSNQPERTRQRHGAAINVIADDPIKWAALPLNVKKYDLLIWGGGHMLQDRSSQLYIPYVTKTLLSAKIVGVPRFIYAPGLGPVVNQFGRSISRLAIEGSAVIIVRDEGSQNLLREIGVKGEIQRTADPVFSLSTRHDEVKHKSTDAPMIGFAPRKLFYRKGSVLPVSMQLASPRLTNSRFEQFIEEAAAGLDICVEKLNARIRLIPMDIGLNPRDDLVCSHIRGQMIHADKAEVLDDDPPLEEFVRRLSELDLLVSARLHGIILGLRYGLPFIGIDSDGKIPRLADRIGVGKFVIKDADFDKDRFYNLAAEALEDGEGLRNNLRRHGEELRSIARQNCDLLRSCLNSFS